MNCNFKKILVLFTCKFFLLLSFKCGSAEFNNDQAQWNQDYKPISQLQENSDSGHYFKKNPELLDQAIKVLSEKSSSKTKKSFFLPGNSEYYDNQE